MRVTDVPHTALAEFTMEVVQTRGVATVSPSPSIARLEASTGSGENCLLLVIAVASNVGEPELRAALFRGSRDEITREAKDFPAPKPDGWDEPARRNRPIV